jgi:hypothetical protein
MDENTKVETSIAFLEIKNEVLYINIKEGANLSLEAAIENVLARKKLQKGKKMLILLDSRNAWQITNETREYAAKKEVTDLNIAMAILTGDSLTERLTNNFYIKFNKPASPAKIFNSEAKALAWLATF